MADDIVIGRLVIDNTDLDRALLDSKKAIIDLENEQKALKKSTDGLSSANEAQLTTFIANEASLKRARAEYAANQRTLLTVVKAQTGLDDALKENIKTQDQAIANTKALTEARRQIDTTTVEGAKAITDINAKIDANNKLINGSSSALEQQKANVGNYPTLMNAVGSSFSGATTQIIGFAQKGKDGLNEIKNVVENFKAAQEASAQAGAALAQAQAIQTTATNTAAAATQNATIIGFRRTQGLATDTEVELANAAATTANAEAQAAQAATTTAATTATTAATTASKALRLAMLAIPLVAILALLTPLISYFTSTQEGIDKVTSVTRPLVAIFESLGGVLQQVGKYLVDTFSNPKKALNDLYEFVKQNLINRFTAFGEILQGIIELDFRRVVDGVAQAGTGVEGLTGKLENAAAKTGKFLDDAIKKGQELDRLEKKLTATKNANLLLIGEQTEAVKKQNSIAEDQTKTTKEREIATQKSIVAAREINRLKNMELDIEIEILKNKQSRNDTSDAEKAELNKLLAAKNGNNATLLELETTQVNKLNGIRKAAADKAKADGDKAFQESLKQAQNRIDILKAEAAQSNLTADARVANAQKVFALENELAQKSLKGTDLQKALLTNRQSLSSSILAIADEQIKAEQDLQKKAFAATKKITEEQRDAQLESANDLAKAQILLLDASLLTEKAYADKVVQIEAAKNEAITSITASFDEGEKARKEAKIIEDRAFAEADFQLRLLELTERGALENEIKLATLTQQYADEQQLLDEALANKSLSEDLYNKKKELADKKYLSEVKKNDKQLADQKRANNIKMSNDAIGALTALFGESKALSIASALMNTYEGITAALKAPTIAQRVIGVTFATATGFAAVKNILKTNKSSTSVDGSSAAAVTTSGSGNFVNTGQTTTVATASERPAEQNTVVSPPVLVLESLMEVQEQVAIKISSS